MTSIHDPWLFSLTVLLLNATPGVDMMLTASRTLQHGLRSGIATALGISAGCAVHALAAAFGLAALLAASAAAFGALKWIGAAYLAWLAVGLLRRAAKDGSTGAPGAREEPRLPTFGALFRQGLLTNVLNPKIAIFFLALLPQFIDADAADKTGAFLLLGAIMVVQGAVFMLLFVAVLSGLRRLHTPRRGLRRGVQAACGTVLLVLATRLALTDGVHLK